MTGDEDSRHHGPGSNRTRRETLAATYGSRPVEHLDLLVTYCDDAAQLVGRGRDAYLDDVLLRRAAEGILNRIGEMAGRSSLEEVRADYPDQPWREIIGMRVRVAHHYTSTDDQIVWRTLADDVPRLRDYVTRTILGD